MRLRGFNLIEVAVASALAGIISIAAIGTFAHLNRQLVQVQRETNAADVAKSVTDMLVGSLQGIGGGAIRPFMAVWVEDGGSVNVRDALFPHPPGIKTDRITWATLVESAPTCAITGMTESTVSSTGVGATCCLSRFLTGLPGAPTKPEAITAYAINGDDHVQVVVFNVKPSPCIAEWKSGVLSVLDRAPTKIVSMSGGTLSRARIKTLYVDDENALRDFEQTDFTTFDLVGTRPTLVSSDVFDMQFQLGYDTNGDGRIRDDASTTDEWLYNVIGENPSTFLPADLRMVATGVVVGVRQTDTGQPSRAHIVGSVEIASTSTFIRAAMGRAALRNLFVFH